MRDFLKKLRKNWITVWLAVAILLTGTFVTYAAYKKVTSVKRVVTTQSSPDVRFSSNCMLQDVYNKKMPAEQFTVTVCNYDQSAKEKYNTAQINYTFTAQLLFKWGDEYIPMSELKTKVSDEEYAKYVAHIAGTDVEEGETPEPYKIQQTQDDDESKNEYDKNEYKFSDYADDDYKIMELSTQSLPGTASNTDKFLVTIPQSDFDETKTFQFGVLVEAEPQGDTSLHKISTRLYGAKNAVVTASWDGNLVEQNTSDYDYDFYNYVITGSGKGKLDIMWNPDYFTVSDFFFNSTLSGARFLNNVTEPVTINDTESAYNGWSKVTLEVNSEDTDDVKGQSRYELQLFKVKSNTPYTGTNDASQYIACVLQPETENTGN